MIFQSAIVHSNILISQRSLNQRRTQTVQFAQDLYRDNLSISNYFAENKVRASHLGEDVWTINNARDLEIRKKVERIGTPLRLWDIEFNRGILTGLNEAFILDGETKRFLLKKDPHNAEIIKPVLRGRDTRKYYCNFSDVWLINAHNGQRSKGIKRIKIQDEFPTIYEYLLPYRAKAKNRLDQGDHWTNLRNCAYLDEIPKPKIIFSEIVSEPQFHFDTKGFYPEATVFFITGKNLKYLISLLNSKPVTYFFKSFYAGGELVGKYRYKKAFMENLPLPVISTQKQKPFENLVDYILLLKNPEQDIQVDDFVSNGHLAEQFEEVIDALVFELYFDDDFRRASLEFQRYAQRDFPSIDGLTQSEKIRTIEAAYQTLRKKDGEIRNNLKLMNIRLAELLGPIKSQR